MAHKLRILCFMVMACAFASPLRADAIYDFTYISTRNNAHNNRAHLLNTGVQVTAGTWVEILGAGQISFGGGFSVRTNFDMGLISPINNSELIRDFYGLGTNYIGALMPLAGETAFFNQDRTSLQDSHDRSTLVQASSDGYIYIGLFDSHFADNTGQHQFQIRLMPEPPLLGALILPALFLTRRSRRG